MKSKFSGPHPPLLYSGVTLTVLVFVSFFKDIDTKQLEGKCTFDAMYEKLLNMQFGKHSFQNLLFNCCLWLKRIWHPKFFQGINVNLKICRPVLQNLRERN